MATISRDPKVSIRAELDDLHKGMVVDLDRRISAIQIAEHSAPPAPQVPSLPERFEDQSDIISLVTTTVSGLRDAHAEIERLEGEKSACIATIEELRGSCLSMSTKNDELTSVVNSLEQQNANLSLEIHQLRTSFEALSEERDAFAKNLSEAERILRRNLAELRYKVE